jgi:hypothetical protein
VRAEIKKGMDILVPAAADKEKAIANATKKIVAKRKQKEDTKMAN